MKRLLPLLTMILGYTIPTGAHAQAVFPFQNSQSLEAVDEFDARVLVLGWLDVEDDHERFQDNAQRQFELALRRDGIQVSTAAPNYLICELSVAESDSGLRFYHWDLNYYDFAIDGVHNLLWQNGGIATVGAANFSPESAVSSCADAFANEWLRWNPR